MQYRCWRYNGFRKWRHWLLFDFFINYRFDYLNIYIEIVCSIESGSGITSGGGFSPREAVPSWQKAFTSTYFSSLNSNQTLVSGLTSGFNKSGKFF